MFYAYIMASKNRVLYTGITSQLEKRVWQHKTNAREGFTARYKIHSLVWFERFADPGAAIAREKEIKGWRREKKIRLIEEENPRWNDLSYGWYQHIVAKFRVREKAAGAKS